MIGALGWKNNNSILPNSFENLLRASLQCDFIKTSIEMKLFAIQKQTLFCAAWDIIYPKSPSTKWLKKLPV